MKKTSLKPRLKPSSKPRLKPPSRPRPKPLQPSWGLSLYGGDASSRPLPHDHAVDDLESGDIAQCHKGLRLRQHPRRPKLNLGHRATLPNWEGIGIRDRTEAHQEETRSPSAFGRVWGAPSRPMGINTKDKPKDPPRRLQRDASRELGTDAV